MNTSDQSGREPSVQRRCSICNRIREDFFVSGDDAFCFDCFSQQYGWD
ncbi:hypothetical protein [Haladaptatus sp. DYF46]|nr:hypothetical protein [Haladaptatus sp. DYF46]